MTWRELKQRLDAMSADVLDRPVLYLEPYDDREIMEPDLILALEDFVDSDGRPRVRAGQPLLG